MAPVPKIRFSVAFAMHLRKLENVQWGGNTTENFPETKEV